MLLMFTCIIAMVSVFIFEIYFLEQVIEHCMLV